MGTGVRETGGEEGRQGGRVESCYAAYLSGTTQMDAMGRVTDDVERAWRQSAADELAVNSAWITAYRGRTVACLIVSHAKRTNYDHPRGEPKATG